MTLHKDETADVTNRLGYHSNWLVLTPSSCPDAVWEIPNGSHGGDGLSMSTSLTAAIVKTSVLAASLLVSASASLAASTARERMALVRARLASTRDRCEMGDVRLSAASVSCFDKLELTFRLAASYTNPYDPDDIRVEAAITLPDGSAVTVPAFYFDPFRPVRSGATRLRSP